MKKLFTLIAIFLISSIVLSSCSSNMSITKRRYTKGYHVSRSQKPSETKDTQVAKHVNKNTKATEAIKVMPEIQPERISTSAQQSNEALSASAPLKKEAKTKSISSGKSPFAKTFADISVKKPVKTIDQAIKKHKLSASSDRDGLSLFWIVILVLLILWALGFISGNFGGIINLLLIIALILLILWLLRIL